MGRGQKKNMKNGLSDLVCGGQAAEHGVEVQIKAGG